MRCPGYEGIIILPESVTFFTFLQISLEIFTSAYISNYTWQILIDCWPSPFSPSGVDLIDPVYFTRKQQVRTKTPIFTSHVCTRVYDWSYEIFYFDLLLQCSFLLLLSIANSISFRFKIEPTELGKRTIKWK